MSRIVTIEPRFDNIPAGTGEQAHLGSVLAGLDTTVRSRDAIVL